MTEPVVDLLEVVEVAEQHDDRVSLVTARSERLPEPVSEQLAVGETGQTVVERLVNQLLLDDVPLGDVARR